MAILTYRDDRPSPAALLVRMIITATAAFLSSYAAVDWSIHREAVFSPIWPASGVIFAALLFWGPWMIPGVYVGVAASNALWDFNAPMTWIGPLGLVFESVATIWLLTRWLGPRPRLTDLRSCFAFLLWAPWLPVALNSLYGFLLLFLGGSVEWSAWRQEVPVFTLANGAGLVLFGSAFAVWTSRPDAAWWRTFLAVGVITLALGFLLFFERIPLTPYFLLLPLLTAAVMLGLRGAAPLLAAVALLAATGTFLGHGPLAGESAFFVLYQFLAILAFTVLPVAAIIEQYRTRQTIMAGGARSAGLVFWTWHRDHGVRLEDGRDDRLLVAPKTAGPDPALLFETTAEHGLRETEIDGRSMLSAWSLTGRTAAGEPDTATGVLFDLSERLSLEEARRQAWQSGVELRNLRASLTPHLLFNCLAAVRGIVRTDPERARSFIDHLARFLRDSTNAQSRETIPLLDEWQLCEDFLSLQAMRYERELPRLVEIEGAAYHARVPPMILLNLVENAVKHGEVGQQNPLIVRAHLTEGSLHAVVRSRGKLGPMPSDRPGGLGIARARLQAVYGSDATLDIRQAGEDVIAELRLPAA
jgi:integral membrane sensor domain MASE1